MREKETYKRSTPWFALRLAIALGEVGAYALLSPSSTYPFNKKARDIDNKRNMKSEESKHVTDECIRNKQ